MTQKPRVVLLAVPPDVMDEVVTALKAWSSNLHNAGRHEAGDALWQMGKEVAEMGRIYEEQEDAGPD